MCCPLLAVSSRGTGKRRATACCVDAMCSLNDIDADTFAEEGERPDGNCGSGAAAGPSCGADGAGCKRGGCAAPASKGSWGEGSLKSANSSGGGQPGIKPKCMKCKGAVAQVPAHLAVVDCQSAEGFVASHVNIKWNVIFMMPSGSTDGPATSATGVSIFSTYVSAATSQS